MWVSHFNIFLIPLYCTWTIIFLCDVAGKTPRFWSKLNCDGIQPKAISYVFIFFLLHKNKESIFAITKKLDFRSMANPKGSWWVTSGTPWFPNWLNAFTACWTLLANAEEISSLIRYISMAIIMIGATVIFNDSSWFYIFKSYVADLAVHFLATIQMRASSLFEHDV